VRRSQLQKFNLLVGCPRDRERAARSEVQYFIGDLLEDSGLRVSMTRISGLITCMTTLNPIDVVKSLREFAVENPYQFRFAIRFTPLELCVESTIEKIAEAASQLLPRIDEDETFRVTVRRRHTTLENMEIVTAVAEMIPRRVDLENPDRTLWVEVVGELTGVSVLLPDDILSIMTMRDDMY
jgi:tRNA acetyltransferase TAN1